MLVAIVTNSKPVEVRHVSDEPNWQRAEMMSIVGGALRRVRIKGCPECIGLIAEDGITREDGPALKSRLNRDGGRLVSGMRKGQALICPLLICGEGQNGLAELSSITANWLLGDGGHEN